jgi:hypothetical protein
MPPVGFELKISAGERPKTYALDRAATGTGEKVAVGHTYWDGTDTFTTQNKLEKNF